MWFLVLFLELTKRSLKHSKDYHRMNWIWYFISPFTVPPFFENQTPKLPIQPQVYSTIIEGATYIQCCILYCTLQSLTHNTIPSSQPKGRGERFLLNSPSELRQDGEQDVIMRRYYSYLSLIYKYLCLYTFERVRQGKITREHASPLFPVRRFTTVSLFNVMYKLY